MNLDLSSSFRPVLRAPRSLSDFIANLISSSFGTAQASCRNLLGDLVGKTIFPIKKVGSQKRFRSRFNVLPLSEILKLLNLIVRREKSALILRTSFKIAVSSGAWLISGDATFGNECL